MPRVVKQQTTAPAAEEFTIQPCSEMRVGVRLSVYGEPKSGKTRLAATFPKPLLIIGAEDGTASVVGMQGVNFALITQCQQLENNVLPLVKAQRYKTLVIEITSLRDTRIAEIVGFSGPVEQKGRSATKGEGGSILYSGGKRYVVSREQWSECGFSIKSMLRPFCDLARRGILENLVFTSHQQTFNASDNGEISDLIKPSISCALGESLKNWVNGECDCVGQMFTRMQVVNEVQEPIKGQKITIQRRTGEVEYCLLVKPDGIHEAGFRLANGRVVKEAVIVNPDFAKIHKLITG
jgi:hypothetical protein